MRLRERVGDVEDAGSIIDRVRDNFEEVDRLPAAIVGCVRESYTEALRGVLLITCGFSVIYGVLGVFMR